MKKKLTKSKTTDGTESVILYGCHHMPFNNANCAKLAGLYQELVKIKTQLIISDSLTELADQYTLKQLNKNPIDT